MLRSLWIVAAWCLVVSLRAEAGSPIMGTELGVAGWSADEAEVALQDADGAWVISARNGKLIHEGDEAVQWIARHSLKPSPASRESADHQARADIVISRSATDSGSWKGSTWHAPAKSGALFQVVRAGKTTTSWEWTSAFEKVEAHWSPSGKRILWLSTRPWHGMDGSSSYEYGVGPGGGPRIQLLANKALLAQAIPTIAPLIEKAGFAPTWTGPANENRERSVVYAAKGFEDAARQMADALPGGATVETLSWKTPFDVVVAIGKSAMRTGAAP